MYNVIFLETRALSVCAKAFEKEGPDEYEYGTKSGCPNDDIAGERGVSAHLLRHGEGGDGGGCGQAAQQGNEFRTPEAQSLRGEKRDAGQDGKLSDYDDDEVTAVLLHAGKLEKRA